MTIINSLLDQDLYKFSMMQTVLHQFPATQVEYKFACRNEGVDLTPYVDEIRQEIDNLGSLRFTEAELKYLSTIRFLKSDFIDFLRVFQLNPKFVEVQRQFHSNSYPTFDLRIKGPWLHTILFEVPILALVNEIYFRHNSKPESLEEGERRLSAKIKLLKNAPDNFFLSEFGTRRRRSFEWQKYVLGCLKELKCVTGTSNVHLGRIFSIKIFGTMAHEFLMAGQSVRDKHGFQVRLADSQKYMLEAWDDEYRGDLGIALTDTIGIDAFLRDFDMHFAKLYDGVRCDSGNPYDFGEKVIAHYKKLNIDPMTKVAVFTDSLDIIEALKIHSYFKGRIKTSFGIGTSLTNDMTEKPINIVIKLVKCNDQPVAKISDSPAKNMCEDKEYVSYLKKVFGVA